MFLKLNENEKMVKPGLILAFSIIPDQVLPDKPQFIKFKKIQDLIF